MSLLSVICEIIQTGVAVSALLLEVSERIGKKKGKDDRNLLTACQVEKINKSKMLNKRG